MRESAKALDHASGDICGIQSSDDYYSDANVFTEVAKYYSENPQLILLAGYHIPIDHNLLEVQCPPPAQKEMVFLIGEMYLL